MQVFDSALSLYEGKYKDCSHNFDSVQGSKFYDSAHIFDSVRFSKSETCDMFCQCMKENTMTVHIILQCTRKQTQRQCTYFWQCRRSKSLTVHIALSVYEREYNDWFYCMYSTYLNSVRDCKAMIMHIYF